MRYTTSVIIAIAIGMVVGFVGPVAAQPELSNFVLQVDEFGPLLELIARLFDISVTIEG